MNNIDTLKLYLDIAEDTSRDWKLQTILDLCGAEYLSRTHQDVIDDNIVVEMAVERVNQLGNEGLASINYSGITEAYRSDYSEKVKSLLRSKTRMRTL